jgi:hypothetical protein
LFLPLFRWPISAIAAPPPQDSPASSVIRGTVVNKVTHEPVSRALVSSLDGSLAAMTDGEGLSCRRNEARPESSHPLESRIFGGIIKLVGIAGARTVF